MALKSQTNLNEKAIAIPWTEVQALGKMVTKASAFPDCPLPDPVELGWKEHSQPVANGQATGQSGPPPSLQGDPSLGEDFSPWLLTTSVFRVTPDVCAYIRDFQRLCKYWQKYAETLTVKTPGPMGLKVCVSVYL